MVVKAGKEKCGRKAALAGLVLRGEQWANADA